MRPFFIFLFFLIGISTSKFLIWEKKFSCQPQKCKFELYMSNGSEVLIYLSFLLFLMNPAKREILVLYKSVFRDFLISCLVRCQKYLHLAFSYYLTYRIVASRNTCYYSSNQKFHETPQNFSSFGQLLFFEAHVTN